MQKAKENISKEQMTKLGMMAAQQAMKEKLGEQ